MKEFRKKQVRLKKILNICVVFTVVYLFVYYGVAPMLETNLSTILDFVGFGFVIATVSILFVYSSKYGRCDKFLESVENEINDNGYYLYARNESNIEDYIKSIKTDLVNNGFSVNDNVEIDELEFCTRGIKKNEFVYIIDCENVDKNDIVAYLQSAMYDVTSVNIRRKCNSILVYVCNKADDEAISLSKMITPLGKKEQIKFANAIIELDTGRCYCLGNVPTKCQQMIVNYAMGCDIPLEDRYIAKDKLEFQYELEKKMESFNIKDFKNDNFYVH